MQLRFWASEGTKSEHFINEHMYQQPHDKGFRLFPLKEINLNMEQNKTKMHLNNLIWNLTISLCMCVWYWMKILCGQRFF